MNYQDALNEMKICLKECEAFKKRERMLYKAVNALERLVPAKVIDGGKLNLPVRIGSSTYGANTHILQRCPRCNDYVSPIINEKFCTKCGQALDWKEYKRRKEDKQ